MTPTLASLFIGEWFGPAPTIIGIVLLAFWAWVKWSNRPVERLNFRFMGVVLLVISSSLWLGFEKGGASTTGYGGDFGAFFSGRFADGWISTLAMFMVGLAALLSIPLATDWLFLPMFLKYRTKQGLAAAPVLGSVGGYKIVGAYAHEGSAPPAAPGTQSAPEVDAPNETEAPSATAVADRDEAAAAIDDPASTPDEGDDDVAPASPAADEDLPWYMRRRPRGASAPTPRGSDEDLAPRTSSTRTRGETTARFQLEPETEPEPTPTPIYESRRRARMTRYAEPESEPAAPQEAGAGASSDAAYEAPQSSGALAEPETYEETEADASPSIDEIAQAPVAERAETPEAATEQRGLDAALDDAFAFADDASSTTTAEPPAPTIDEAAAAPVVEAEPQPTATTRSIEAAADEADEFETDVAEDDADDAAEHDDDTEASTEAAVREDREPTSAASDATDSEAVEPSTATEPARTTVVEREPAAALSEDDLAFVKAGDLVVAQSKASISFLQKQLGVGYFQAAKLLDRLEKEKIIGPYTGGVNRDVLIDLVEWQAKKSSMG